MVSLQNISGILSENTISNSELDYRLCKIPQRKVESIHKLDAYPEINLKCESYSALTVSSNDSWHNVLVPVNEGVIKRIIRIYFENGFMDALHEASDLKNTNTFSVISSVAAFTFRMLGLLEKLNKKVFPHINDLGMQIIANHSETRDWLHSCIRCIVWHPNFFKIAVAGSDDIVRIYTDEPAVVPMLKNGNQKWITTMAWRPHSVGELVVGCNKGFCVWSIESNMHITRTTIQPQFIRHPNGCVVNSIQWSPDGSLLATASIGDADLHIWDMDKSRNTVLRRVGPPCSILKWSPNGAYLFSATVGKIFRVWRTDKNWTPERWIVNIDTVQSACWSPCSSFLLFVTSHDSILYRLAFFEEQLFTADIATRNALPIADLSKCIINDREVGGKPQVLAWDPNGLYLAISFKDSPCIAIFSTCIQKFSVKISPSFFLTGLGIEHPSYISFRSKTHKNWDSVLTICWSSGRMQFFPVINT